MKPLKRGRVHSRGKGSNITRAVGAFLSAEADRDVEMSTIGCRLALGTLARCPRDTYEWRARACSRPRYPPRDRQHRSGGSFLVGLAATDPDREPFAAFLDVLAVEGSEFRAAECPSEAQQQRSVDPAAPPGSHRQPRSSLGGLSLPALSGLLLTGP